MKRTRREMSKNKQANEDENAVTSTADKKGNAKESATSGSRAARVKAVKKKFSLDAIKTSLSSSVGERTKSKRASSTTTEKDKKTDVEDTKDGLVTSTVGEVKETRATKTTKVKPVKTKQLLLSKSRGRPLKGKVRLRGSAGKSSKSDDPGESMVTDDIKHDCSPLKKENSPLLEGTNEVNQSTPMARIIPGPTVSARSPRLSVRARLRSSSGSEDGKTKDGCDTPAQVSKDTCLLSDVKKQELDESGDADTTISSNYGDETTEQENTSMQEEHSIAESTSTTFESINTKLESPTTTLESPTTTMESTDTTMESTNTKMESTNTTMESTNTTMESTDIIMESTCTKIESPCTTLESTTATACGVENEKRNKKKHKGKKKEKKKSDVVKTDNEPEEEVHASTSTTESNVKVVNIEEGDDSMQLVNSGEKEIVNVGEEEMDEDNEAFPPETVRYIPIDIHADFHGIVLLTQFQLVAIHGCTQLAVVHGDIDIAGYRTTQSDAEGELKYVDVYSSTTSSLVYIKDQTTNVPSKEELLQRLSTDLASTLNTTTETVAELLDDIENISSCILVKKFHSLLPAVLKKLERFDGFAKEPNFIPQPFEVAVLDTEAWNVMVDEILTEMPYREDGCLCSVMLCGVGNTGKSSLARYVVNRMLAEHTTVYFLDCDCGQTEFTPPSCISLVKVTKPLLGPPFSHLTTPVLSYFYGHISPGETPSEYIKLIGNLFHTYYTDHHDEGPLVINTQGWMQGLGLSLLVDCIRLTSPCHIVHINSPTDKRNVPVHLSDELLQEEKGWYYDNSYKCIKNGHGCTYHHLPVTEVQSYYSNLRKFKSRVSRDQCVSSYFSSLYQPFLDHHMSKGMEYCDWIPPPMSVLLPYVVRWKDMALHIMHEKVTSDVMLFGFNFTLVGLARVDPELIKPGEEDSEEPQYLLDQPEAECIGFGIVRNIDPTNKLFYILTPVPKEKLHRVNALLRGSAQLPTSYFLEDANSDRPYYCADYINVASKTASSMKPRYNLKRRPAKIKAVERE